MALGYLPFKMLFLVFAGAPCAQYLVMRVGVERAVNKILPEWFTIRNYSDMYVESNVTAISKEAP